MATKVAVSMEEYLGTAYEYDPEWVDGELVERSLPTYPHSRAERRIVQSLASAEGQAKLFSAPNQRIWVSPDRWRVPDVSIFADREPEGPYPSNVFAAIEILSPKDAMAAIYDKLSEYAAAGIQHLWVVDPGHKLVLKYERRSLIEVDAIEFPERAFRITAEQIFA
jgi:Uma2 family endonuclease